MVKEFLHVNIKLSFLDHNIENGVHTIWSSIFTVFLTKNKRINWLFFSTETCDSYGIFALKSQTTLFFQVMSHWKGYRAVCISEEHSQHPRANGSLSLTSPWAGFSIQENEAVFSCLVF